MRYLLDTNVVSELSREEPHPSVISWFSVNLEADAYLSVVTFGEIEQGIDRLPLSRKKDRLDSWFHETLLPLYAGNILPVDMDIMLRWGRLTGQRIQAGLRMQVMDALIAATALEHRLTLVTRNVSGFSGIDLNLINPWEM